jgi:hypothetical protein
MVEEIESTHDRSIQADILAGLQCGHSRDARARNGDCLVLFAGDIIEYRTASHNVSPRRNWPWAVAAIVAFAVGAAGARPYARLAAPYYQAAAECLAQGRPWLLAGVDVVTPASSPGAVLQLTGWVRHYARDARPAARVVSKLQVAAVVQSPLIFWTVLLMWPATSRRERLARLFLGIPVFLGLEAATTVCQLLSPLASISAMLDGNPDPDPLTLWERWSRFLEDGGRPVLALGAAIFAATVAKYPMPSSPIKPSGRYH